TALISGDATISRQSLNACRAPQACRAASALSGRVVQTAVNSTSALARAAGKCERDDQVPLTLAPISASRIFPAISPSPSARLRKNPRLLYCSLEQRRI